MGVQVHALACPSCGASLTIDAGVDHLHCAYCKVGLLVEKTSNSVSLHDATRLVSGVNQARAELAITRLRGEIRDLEESLSLVDQYEALKRTQSQLDTGVARRELEEHDKVAKGNVWLAIVALVVMAYGWHKTGIFVLLLVGLGTLAMADKRKKIKFKLQAARESGGGLGGRRASAYETDINSKLKGLYDQVDRELEVVNAGKASARSVRTRR